MDEFDDLLHRLAEVKPEKPPEVSFEERVIDLQAKFSEQLVRLQVETEKLKTRTATLEAQMETLKKQRVIVEVPVSTKLYLGRGNEIDASELKEPVNDCSLCDKYGHRRMPTGDVIWCECLEPFKKKHAEWERLVAAAQKARRKKTRH